MLPWLRDRPLVSTRFPDGISGKSFYQHDAPVFAPAWFRTERIFSEHRSSWAAPEREPHDVDYLICDDVESLLFMANLGTIPIHVWSSRVQSLGRPDWCVLDLDPKDAPFAHVVEVALALRRLCDEIGLPAFVKTSGQAGLHVLIPLGAQLTHEQSRSLGELLARVIVDELPAIATLARVIAARGGRVYLDYLQNGHGKTIAAPWCVRPVAGAPVSMPLRWSEVNAKLDPRAFTIRTAPRRLKRTPTEPELLHLSPDLAGALARLDERMRKK
jgi:bifunctional non-homologous end joining protein LigD